ncbi:hypothetical protein [Paraliobacillus salinarum]|uniref:hypothetical protein n=1 Tax=Paraliobacillus salinarum TaxID=1158996 RepID=UPI0015F5D58F|nr:hypothetical protein [Paraliobacillus salinarum]
MTFENNYLAEDHRKLNNLIGAMHGNALQAINLSLEGRNDEADLCAYKMIHCLKEVKKLNHKKIEKDKQDDHAMYIRRTFFKRM